MASSGTTPAPSPDMEMAHVLFMDIVAYSQLPIDEQVTIINELKQAVSETPSYRAARDKQTLISIHTGDGMALAFFGSPEDPVHCAMELANSLRNHPRIKLRMGINTGPVYRVPDIKGEPNVAGGGVNFAQRVMDCGDAGHILLSASIADVLRQHGRWAPMIHDVGIAEVKHGEHVHVSNLFGGPVGNPATPAKLQNQTVNPAPQTPGSRRAQPVLQQLPGELSHRSRPVWWTWTAAFSFVLVLGASLTVGWRALTSPQPTRPIVSTGSGTASSVVAPAPTIQGWAGSDSVNLGEPITISWAATNSTGVTLYYGKEQVRLPPTGKYDLHPSTAGTETVRLIAQGQQGQTAAQSVEFRVIAVEAASAARPKHADGGSPASVNRSSASTNAPPSVTAVGTSSTTSMTPPPPPPALSPTNTVMLEAPNVSPTSLVSTDDVTSSIMESLKAKGYQVVSGSAPQPVFVVQAMISITPRQQTSAVSRGGSILGGILKKSVPTPNLVDVTVNCTVTVQITRNSDRRVVGRANPSQSLTQKDASDYGQAVSQLAPACWQQALQDAMAQMPSRP